MKSSSILTQRFFAVRNLARYVLTKVCLDIFDLDDQVPRTKTPFADAVVFVVGGGNYIEHQNLQVEKTP